jgi:hypothetical protein
MACERKLRGAAFNRGDLEQFLAGSWPLGEETPDEAVWGRAFVDAR